MNKRTPIEELDLAIDALLAGPREAAPKKGVRQATLVRVAAELCDLPSENFKARLKAELQRGAAMATPKTMSTPKTMTTSRVSTTTVGTVPKGYRTITPYLQVMPVDDVVNFVKQAFGGEELFRARGGAGGFHIEMKVGDSMLMVGGGGTWQGPARPAGLLIYVDDADESYRRAMEAGATSIHEAVTQPYGDREGSVTDAAGNYWYITTRRVSEYAPAGYGDILLGFMPNGAARFIDFVTAAFGAETIFRHDNPNGTVGHARIRIGDSIVMVSEPRGRYQTMPA